MKHYKLIIFLIAIIFMLSVNFAFACDDNATDLTGNVETEQLLDESTDSDMLAYEKIQTIKMGEVTKRYNGAIEYKATFYNSYGNPLNNTKVYFQLDDNLEYEKTTDDNGIVLLTILVTNGNHKIAALNPESSEISDASFKVFDVITGGKNINTYYDNGDAYKVRVLDDSGNPVKAGQKVTFNLNGKKYIKTTDKNGFVSLKITLKPGFYTVYTQYRDFIVSNNILVKNVVDAKTGDLGKLKSKTKFKVFFPWEK